MPWFFSSVGESWDRSALSTFWPNSFLSPPSVDPSMLWRFRPLPHSLGLSFPFSLSISLPRHASFQSLDKKKGLASTIIAMDIFRIAQGHRAETLHLKVCETSYKSCELINSRPLACVGGFSLEWFACYWIWFEQVISTSRIGNLSRFNQPRQQWVPIVHTMQTQLHPCI